MNTPKRGSRYMLLLFCYILFVQFFLGGFLSALGLQWIHKTPYIHFLSEGIVFGLPFIFYLQITRQTLFDVLPHRKLDFKNICYILAMCVCLDPAMMLLSALSSLAFPNAAQQILEPLRSAPVLLSLLAVGVTPALCEEITFRGAIQSNFRNVDIKKSALITGLFFGMIHMNLQQFAYAFVLGIAFAFFIHHTGSIYATMLAHFYFNGSHLLLSNLVGRFARADDPVSDTATRFYALWPVAVIAVIFLLLYRVMYKKFAAHNRRNTEEISPPAEAPPAKILTWEFWVVCALYLVLASLLLYSALGL